METLPRDVGQYRLEQKIGQGGMGVVYRATDTVLDRSVAVKLISLAEELSQDERDTALRRFQREAKSAGRIQSRHVAQVLNFGRTDNGELYIAMELLEGIPLSKLLASEKRLAPTRAVRIARQLCRGLQAAHDLGIVHRDLKAANVMIVKADGIDEFVKLLDFGVAKVSRETDRGSTTQQGAVVGTLNVMAPEQLEGEAIDARADIYAMGVLLYRMLGGVPVFEAPDVATLIRHQLKTRPVALGKRVPDANIPPALDAVVLRCLEKKPADRPASMKEVEQLLAQAVGQNVDVTDPGAGLVPRSTSRIIPSVELETQPTTTGKSEVSTVITEVMVERQRRRLGVLGAAWAAAVLGVVAAVVILVPSSSEEPAPPFTLDAGAPKPDLLEIAPAPVPVPDPAPPAPVMSEAAATLPPAIVDKMLFINGRCAASPCALEIRSLLPAPPAQLVEVCFARCRARRPAVVAPGADPAQTMPPRPAEPTPTKPITAPAADPALDETPAFRRVRTK